MSGTTTIRVSNDTRDQLKALSKRHGRSAGEMVADLVHAADDDLLLADAEECFAQMANNPRKLSTYRSETAGIEAAFDDPIPDW